MTTEQMVLAWAKERNILTQGHVLSQIGKTLEEIGELLDALATDDIDAIRDARGDIEVTWIIASHMLTEQYGDTRQQCLDAAYNTIKNRTGHMVNGRFVRDPV
jgi:NTP pyrophosphatase (non-canonical NTP hydrolase)